MASNYDALVQLIQKQLNAHVPSITSGNSNQIQAGAQTGQYASTGGTAQQQVGTTTGTTAGTTGPTNTMGLSQLVAGQAPAVAASDQASNAYLTDFMNTGGTGFNAQVNNAVRGSLSGPGVSGAGESAQARVAGRAAGDIAMNNSAQRLQAAQTLRGGTGVGALTQQATPLMGQTTNQTTGQASNTALTGTETQAGTAEGGSASAGYGNAPTSTQSSGGCMLCSVYADMGLIDPEDVRQAVRYKLANLDKYGLCLRGYALYGPSIARLVMKFGAVKWALLQHARLVLYEEVRRSGSRPLKRRLAAVFAHAFFHYSSLPWGLVSRLIGHDGGVHDPKVLAVLERNNLKFNYNLEDR